MTDAWQDRTDPPVPSDSFILVHVQLPFSQRHAPGLDRPAIRRSRLAAARAQYRHNLSASPNRAHLQSQTLEATLAIHNPSQNNSTDARPDQHGSSQWLHNLLRTVVDGKTDDTLSTQHGSTRVRIERRGNQFTALAGEPGQTLVPGSPVTVVMEDPV
jgi:hypothetical protein